MKLYSGVVTGSLSVQGNLTVTGTANLSSSNAISSSYANNANLLDGLDSTSFVFTSSFNTVSSSFSSRVANTEATSSALTTASSSFSTRVTATEATASNFIVVSSSLSTRVTNTESTSSALTTASSSFSTRVTNTESTASAYVAASSSLSTRVTATEATASAYVTTSGSFSTRIANTEATSSALTTASSSFSTRVTATEATASAYVTTSGSLSTRVTATEATASSLTTASGSFSSRVSTIESKYITTGSNSFNGSQTITGSLTATGTITAQTLVVQTVTSSIVYSSGSNQFGQNTGNTQSMTGSVGISGSLTINGVTTSNSTITGTTVYASSTACSPTGLFSGCVGIGTASPSYKLHIIGGAGYFDGAGAGSFVIYTTNNDQGNARIRMNNSGTGGQTFDLVSGLNGTSNAGWSIYDATNASTRFSISSTGAATFACSVTVNGSNIALTPSTSTAYALSVMTNSGGYFRVGRDTSTGTLYGADYAALLVSSGNYHMILGTNDTERMRITNGGEVLIGTTTDSGDYKLQVNGNEYIKLTQGAVQTWSNSGNSSVNIRTNTGYNSILAFTEEGVADRWSIGTKSADGSLYFSTGDALGAVKLTLSSAGAATFVGNITVDKSSPNISINAPSGTSGQYNINNGVGSLMWTMYSTTGGSNAQGNWLLYSAGKTGGAGDVLTITPAGAATFSSTATATGFTASTTSPLFIADATSTTYYGGLSIRCSNTEKVRFAGNSTDGAYIYTPEGLPFSVITCGGTKLSITAAGAATFASSVTLSNSAGNLDVGGVAIIRGNGGACNTHYFTTGNANVAKYFQYDSVGAIKNLIDACGVTYFTGGNVGINSSTPKSIFDISQSTPTVSIVSTLNSEATTDNQTLAAITFYKHYGIANGAGIRMLQAGGANNYAQAHLTFLTTSDGNPYTATLYERMRIDKDGNVGINTTAPVSTLQVCGTATATLFSAPEFHNATGYPYNTIFGSGANASTATLRAGSTSGYLVSIVLQGGDVGNNIAFNTASSERMRIDSSGNVGIGTTNPTKKLQISISNASHCNEGILLSSSGGYGEGAIYHDYNQGNGLTAFKLRNLYGGSEINLSQDSYSSAGSPSSIIFSTSITSGGNTPIERMRITSGGDIKVNTCGRF